MTISRILLSGTAALALLGTSACVTDPNTGEKKISRTAIGTGLGGTLGYLLGGAIGGDTGRIIGAGIGGSAGAILGKGPDLAGRQPVGHAEAAKGRGGGRQAGPGQQQGCAQWLVVHAHAPISRPGEGPAWPGWTP